jgi:class 3 adenylate cyclase
LNQGCNGSVSLKRLDHKVIGDVLNTVSCLESAAGPGQIVISANSYGKVKESFKCERVGEVKLKNKANPLVIYEVVE